ncbi:FtsX-like permease family protein [Peptococcus simiae]|uniref:FtsX-like permease family protein n=1 Tax=Peptococcus simiae TaxID=1643805 RepID=UPI00397EF5FE
MNKYLRAYALRQISGAPLRYLAIFTMLLLSAFVFIGLVSIGPTMEKTLVDYAEESRMADMTITHPLGLSPEDIRLVAASPGIEDMTTASQVAIESKPQKDVLILEGLADFPIPEVVAGRLPAGPHEIAIENKLAASYPLGSQVSVQDADQNPPAQVDTDTFTVVGHVNSPEHLQHTFSQKRVPLGDGTVDAFAWIEEDHFAGQDRQIIRLFYRPGTDLEEAKKDLQQRLARRASSRQEDLLRQAQQGLAQGDQTLVDEYHRLTAGPSRLYEQDKELAGQALALQQGPPTLLAEEAQGRGTLRSQEMALADRAIALRQGEAQLALGLKKYDRARQDLAEKEADLARGQAEVKTGWTDLREKQASFNRQKAYLARQDADLQEAEASLAAANQQVAAGKRALAREEARLNEGQAQWQAGNRRLTAEQARLAEGRLALGRAQEDLDQKAQQLAPAKEKLQQLRQKASQVQEGLAQLAASQKAEEEKIRSQAANRLAPLQQKEATLQADVQRLTLERQIILATEPDAHLKLAAITAQLNAKKKELIAVREDMAQVEAERDQSLAALDQGYATRRQGLEGQAKALANGQATLERQIQPAQAALAEGQAKINAQKASLLAGESQLQQARKKLASEKEKLTSGQLEVAAARISLAAKEGLLKLQKAPLEKARQAVDKGQAALQAGATSLAQDENRLQQSQARLTAGQEALNKGAMTLRDKGQVLAQNQASLVQARQQLAAGRLQLDSARARLDRSLTGAKTDLTRNRQAFSQGLSAYEAFRAASLADIRLGDRALQKAAEDWLDSQLATGRLTMPAYQVQTRMDNADYNIYYNYATGIRLMARIFPVFFYLIALLITLSSMVRMIDEARGQIGTLKALGYANRQITAVYVLYGVAAALPAAFLGTLGGALILVPQIWRTYGSSFIFTEPQMAISPWAIGLAFLLNLSCTALAAYLASNRILQENAASLLRPKAPAIGNRILLEDWQGLWRRLGFQQKMTIRNLFRYKKRGVLTIIGVAGCTALLTMGFGLHHAVANIFPMQFDQLSHYDLLVTYDSNASGKDKAAYQEDLREATWGRLTDRQALRIDEGHMTTDKGINITLTVMVPADPQAFTDRVILRDRRTGQPLDLADGAILTEQTARHMNIGVGDDLVYTDAFGIERRVPITALCEAYVGNTLYMDPANYSQIRGYPPQVNADMVSLKAGIDDRSIVRDILKNDIVLATSRTSDTTANMNQLLDSLGVMIIIIVSVSMSLALVVLYNLTNINVEERMRELSTIKVLGFYPEEVTAYIYRETGFLTLLGILIGLPLGKAMHFNIITVLAPADVMMDPQILPTTFLLASLFTILVSLLVMVLMHQKLRKVDMVEALKGVE